MGRIFKDCFEMIREMDRELKVSGITVPVNHYQNQELSGDDRLTKELIGVSFVISKPYLGKREMLDFMFKDEVELIEKYCRAELSDRLDRNGVNPGKSWEIRRDLWQKLVSKTRQEGRFDYTYSERLHIFHKGPEIHQLDNVITTLRDDPHSRRAMVMIFEPEDTRATAGALTRVPCSVSYQFLIRNNRLHVIYYIRSNDFFKHFAIDIWLTEAMMDYVFNILAATYPSLKKGSLHYFAGSLHAYNEDLSKWVIY